MNIENINIKNNNSNDYVSLKLYHLDYSNELVNSKKRPIIIICPGGGYRMLSDREGEPIAMKYLSQGFHAAVLKYSVKPAEYPTALLELASSVKYLKENAEKYNIDKDNVFLIGFSAGGHLAANYAEESSKEFLLDKLNTDKDSLRLKGLLLSYPVITSGEFAHQNSVNNLLGSKKSQEMIEKISLEKHVNKDMPETFIWHTYTDSSVPVQNSMLMVDALIKAGIKVEFHLYPNGVHGLSLANEITLDPKKEHFQVECEGWMDNSINWMKTLIKQSNN